MLQRAYYDLLKDVVHLSSNIEPHQLKPIIRFSIFEFEDYFGKSFLNITDKELDAYINNYLSQYDIITESI